jgi:hypothetical protein
MYSSEKTITIRSALCMLLVLAFTPVVFAEDAVPGGSAVSDAPVPYTPAWSESRPILSPAQMRIYEQGINRFNLPGPAIPEVAEPQAPDVIRETSAPGNISPMVPGTLSIRRVSSLAAVSTSKSHVLEPAVANDGKYVFFTANWFSARSANNGTSWTYVNPYSDFPSFCCDQDVVHDPARRAIIWFRQGVPDAGGVNSIKVSVSTDGAANFCTYTFSPTNLNASWTTQWFDYPHLSLSNDFLYIATNMFNAADVFQRSLMIRMPLDELSTCAAFTYSWKTGTGTWTPVDGATDNMYWAQHINNTTLRVFKWPESSTTSTYKDVTVPAWSTNAISCITTDGYDACARSDNRILSGWRSDWKSIPGVKMLGFFWNVGADQTFLKPYTNAALIREDTRAYIDRPYIYSSSLAYIYASGAPNARGHIGISVTGVGSYPNHYVGVRDDFSSSWTMELVTTGLKGPNDNKWGDYSRVRPHSPAGLNWVATGWTLDSSFVSVPKFVVFGRDRDLGAFDRWVSY